MYYILALNIVWSGNKYFLSGDSGGCSLRSQKLLLLKNITKKSSIFFDLTEFSFCMKCGLSVQSLMIIGHVVPRPEYEGANIRTDELRLRIYYIDSFKLCLAIWDQQNNSFFRKKSFRCDLLRRQNQEFC